LLPWERQKGEQRRQQGVDCRPDVQVGPAVRLTLIDEIYQLCEIGGLRGLFSQETEKPSSKSKP
jgi:hypothetical protein